MTSRIRRYSLWVSKRISAHTVVGFIGDRFRSNVAGCNVCSAKMAVCKCMAEKLVNRFCLSKTLDENEHD